MIFPSDRTVLYDVEETYKHVKYSHGQDIGPALQKIENLRLHDPQNGMSTGRQFQHVASIPEIAFMVLLQESPEVLKDSKAMDKWLRTDIGRQFKVARDAKPIKGDGLQIIVR